MDHVTGNRRGRGSARTIGFQAAGIATAFALAAGTPAQAGGGAQTQAAAPASAQPQVSSSQSTPPQAPSQSVPDTQVPETGLDIPANLQIFGKLDPNVRKATAIVNDSVITGTDVDQRVGLLTAANNLEIGDADRDRLKLQVLRQIIDETLQIQEAKSHDIDVTDQEIQDSYDRVASNFNRSPADFTKFLKSQGSSEKSLKRQIEGELAWNRYLRRQIEPKVNVGEEEVKAIIARIQAAKGTQEYHLKEIYIRGGGDRAQAAAARASQVMDIIKSGKTPFETPGARTVRLPDQGRRRRSRLDPRQSASHRARHRRDRDAGRPGRGADPQFGRILDSVPRRQASGADRRSARRQAEPEAAHRSLPGRHHRSAGHRARVRVRQDDAGDPGLRVCRQDRGVGRRRGRRPTTRSASATCRRSCRTILLKMQVGQSSPPFGSADGRRPRAGAVRPRRSAERRRTAMSRRCKTRSSRQRVNLRAQQTLRDLRRDAIIEYR